MTPLRRAGLGLLTVLLLAVGAVAVGYATRRPTGPDIRGAVVATPSPVAHDGGRGRRARSRPRPARRAGRRSQGPPATRGRPLAEAPPRAREPGQPLLSAGDNGDGGARPAGPAARSSTGSSATSPGLRRRDHRGGPRLPGQAPDPGDREGRPAHPRPAARHDPEPDPRRDDKLGNQPGPLDQRCLTGRVLCIDKTSSTLRWVVDGKVLETVDVRFGASSTPTREGVFSVCSRAADHVSQLYDSAMPFAMFFSGGQAVHYSSDFAARATPAPRTAA